MEYKRDYFSEVKDLCIDVAQMREFMQNEGVSFDSKSSFHCPFHGEDKNASASLKLDRNTNSAYFNCFSCGTGGDIVKFVELSLGLKPLEAAKYVLNYFGVDTNEVELDEKALAKAQAKKDELAAKRAELARQNALKEAKEQEALEARITPLKQKLQDNLTTHYESLEPEISKLFPNYSKGKVIIDRNLGYSIEHKSIAIMIRDDENGVLKNIKYRQKFAWDKARKVLSDERMSGKWIGEANSSAFPFPLAEYKSKSKNSECVIICEGEKDALNLFSIGECALTLGGVSASWAKYLELLRDKIVYVWFDNDHAGYINAVKKAREIESVAKAVYVVLFNKINPSLPSKYDISDYISDNNISENIIERVTFSAFKLTNDLIDEISELTDTNLKEYKIDETPKTFIEMKQELMAKDKDGNYINITPVRGDLYSEDVIFDAIESFKELTTYKKETPSGRFVFKPTEQYQNFVNDFIKYSLYKETDAKWIENVTKRMLTLFEIDKQLIKEYSKVDKAKAAKSVIAHFKKLGYTFGESKRELYVWNNKSYVKIQDPHTEFDKWIQSTWGIAAHLDRKKQEVQFTESITANIMMLAENIDELRTMPKLKDKRVINLLNGAFIISKNGKVTFTDQHTKALCATNLLNFKYDKNATCPKWQKFLDDVLPDKKDQMCLMEFFGYCLLPNHNYETFLFLYGKSGANGKSVILSVLRSFFGEDNISSLQLQQFYGHELCMLNNKILNIGAEISGKGFDKGQMEMLRLIVSPDDRVPINPKNEKPYSLLPSEKPKLAFAGNEKPKGGVNSAVLRRMLLLSFDKEIGDDKKIRAINERFDDERSGILNMALEGMQRLISQGKFTKSERMQKEIEDYKDDLSPARRFINDCLVADDNYATPNYYLKKVYEDWCDAMGRSNKTDFNYIKNAIKDEFMLRGQRVETTQKPKRWKIKLFFKQQDVDRGFIGFKINPDGVVPSIMMFENEIHASVMSEKIK